MIDQVTVFLENKEGRLLAMTKAMGDAGINMSALTIAETADYGVIRIICNDPQGAVLALTEAGFRAMTAKVVAVELPNDPGGLARLLETLDAANLNIEYGYCFSAKDDVAVDVLKIRDAVKAVAVIAEAGFKVLKAGDLF